MRTGIKRWYCLRFSQDDARIWLSIDGEINCRDTKATKTRDRSRAKPHIRKTTKAWQHRYHLAKLQKRPLLLRPPIPVSRRHAEQSPINLHLPNHSCREYSMDYSEWASLSEFMHPRSQLSAHRDSKSNQQEKRKAHSDQPWRNAK